MTVRTMCPWCSARASSDGLLCQGHDSCTEKLERALGDVRGLVDAASTTYVRGARLSRSPGARAELAPVAFDPRVRPVVHQLTRNVGAVIEMIRLPSTSWMSGMTVGQRAMFAAAHIRHLRGRVDPVDLNVFEALLDTEEELRALIDVPPEQWFVGQCNRIVGPNDATCDTDLYATVDLTDPVHPRPAPFVECPSCGERWPTAERRKVLLEAVDGVLATATDISRSLTQLQDPVTPERIRKWAERGRLVSHGADGRGHPMYRVGEVRELLREQESRLAEMRVRRVSTSR